MTKVQTQLEEATPESERLLQDLLKAMIEDKEALQAFANNGDTKFYLAHRDAEDKLEIIKRKAQLYLEKTK